MCLFNWYMEINCVFMQRYATMKTYVTGGTCTEDTIHDWKTKDMPCKEMQCISMFLIKSISNAVVAHLQLLLSRHVCNKVPVFYESKRQIIVGNLSQLLYFECLCLVVPHKDTVHLLPHLFGGFDHYGLLGLFECNQL